jgi:hypothetical protein
VEEKWKKRKWSHQRGDEVDAGHIIDVIDLDVAPDALVPAALDRAFEYVGVVKVLHRLGAEIDAEVLELTGLRILEAEHVEDADEAVGRMPHCVVQGSHAARSGAT